MRKYRALAAALVTAVPIAMMACGDEGDDSPPGDTGGNAGDAGDDSGGSSTGGRGGSTQGGNAGEETGGTSGAAGDGNTGGTGGDAGGDTGGSTSGGSGGSGGAPPEECDLSGEGQDQETVPSDIMDDLTLTSGTTWVLDGFVKVHSGATLTIEPCTRIEGTPAPSPGVLAILRGAQINAVGDADNPILFTSQSPPGARAAGQWGGVVILGNAPITAATDSKIFEGLTDADFTYGGDAPEDDSGSVSYVRIEFGGWNILPDKEINGLSLGGVGSGTTIDHIMVTQTRDDCFEWWGGTVDASYLICNNPGDDMFDTDEGYIANGDYWFGRRVGIGVLSSPDPTGFEWDGTEGGADISPRTAVTLTNATICGTGAQVSAGGGAPELGMVLRELINGDIDNLALTGFEYGIDTRNAFVAGDVTISNSSFFQLFTAIGSPDGTDNDSGFVDDSIFLGGTGNDPDPDPVPFTVAQCNAEGGPAAAVKDSDIGAFAGDAEWMDGMWVDWSDE